MGEQAATIEGTEERVRCCDCGGSSDVRMGPFDWSARFPPKGVSRLNVKGG